MKNAAPRLQPRAAVSKTVDGRDCPLAPISVPELPSSLQDDLHRQLANEGIPIASFWKSPRDRTRAVQVTLRSYKEHAYLDSRIFEMDRSGRMRPTDKGLAIGIAKLPQFADAIGKALRKAHALGLTAGSST